MDLNKLLFCQLPLLLTSVCVFVCVYVCVCVCSHIPYVNCFGRTVLYVCA